MSEHLTYRIFTELINWSVGSPRLLSFSSMNPLVRRVLRVDLYRGQQFTGLSARLGADLDEAHRIGREALLLFEQDA